MNWWVLIPGIPALVFIAWAVWMVFHTARRIENPHGKPEPTQFDWSQSR